MRRERRLARVGGERVVERSGLGMANVGGEDVGRLPQYGGSPDQDEPAGDCVAADPDDDVRNEAHDVLRCRRALSPLLSDVGELVPSTIFWSSMSARATASGEPSVTTLTFVVSCAVA